MIILNLNCFDWSKNINNLFGDFDFAQQRAKMSSPGMGVVIKFTYSSSKPMKQTTENI